MSYEVDGRRVGYLFFRNFVRPSVAALDEAFASLREAGVSELVLDLRYNGGGLVDVAVHLASLIGGALTAGSPSPPTRTTTETRSATRRSGSNRSNSRCHSYRGSSSSPLARRRPPASW